MGEPVRLLVGRVLTRRVGILIERGRDLRRCKTGEPVPRILGVAVGEPVPSTIGVLVGEPVMGTF